MLKPVCLGLAALGLLSVPAFADGVDLNRKSRTAKPVKVIREVVYQPARPLVVPPCIEIKAVLLECTPRVYLPYGPDWRVLQSSLVIRQQTPYPKLSFWPPYY